jgi:hypothetical protein
MRVYLTEKPSVARAVAEYLGASGKKAEGFIPLRNGDVVTWNMRPACPSSRSHG